MGQILHGCAKTTETIRRAIQNSKESIAKLSRYYNLNPKTIIKWRKRSFAKDADMGPKHARSTVLTLEEEAVIVAFRKHTLLPLDDCLYALQTSIPHLTRSSLHRCLQRHSISRLPDVDGEVKPKKKFKQYPIGYFHIDIAEVRTEEGKLYLFVAIDRTSKFTYVELHKSATKPIAAEFLRNLIKILPYKIHTILTDNSVQFIALFTIIRTDRNMLLACYSHKHISYRIRTIIRKAIPTKNAINTLFNIYLIELVKKMTLNTV